MISLLAVLGTHGSLRATVYLHGSLGSHRSLQEAVARVSRPVWTPGIPLNIPGSVWEVFLKYLNFKIFKDFLTWAPQTGLPADECLLDTMLSPDLLRGPET